MFEEDVFFCDVAKDQRDFSLFVGVVENSADELVHWRDASATSDAGDVGVFVGGPRVFGDGAFEGEQLPWCHAVDVFGHGAIGVDFDKKVHEAAVTCEGRIITCLVC